MEYWQDPKDWPDTFANWVNPLDIKPDDEIINTPIGKIPVRLYEEKMTKRPRLAPWVKEEYLKPGDTFVDYWFGLVPVRDPYVVYEKQRKQEDDKWRQRLKDREEYKKQCRKSSIILASFVTLLAGGCGYLLYLVMQLR